MTDPRIAAADAVRSVRDLPVHLQAGADALLTSQAEAMEDRGYQPRQIARDVGLLLLKLAWFQPPACPTLAEYELSGTGEGWPWASNEERRTAIFDAQGYGAAYDLWRARNREATPA